MTGAARIESSYAPGDVTMLLKRVALAPTGVAEKERLIQSGAAHYSQMISRERRPDATYMRLYRDALDRSDARIAHEIAGLAEAIRARIGTGALDPRVTLCSLVRAGLPYGVLLRRALAARGVDVAHFGVSIIRDRGLDAVAVAHVLDRRPRGGVIFVDGWTGKGAISGELDRSWRALAGGAAPVLAVLADPGGFADLCGSHEDWLIPSGILGANVSGLVSRSILNAAVVGPGDFHGAVPVDHLADIDVSRAFVDRVSALMPADAPAAPVATQAARAALRQGALAAVHALAARHGAVLNRVKPGIAEATRAVLRRRPRIVYMRSRTDPDLAALSHLCARDGIETVESPPDTGPYRAVTVIEKVA